MEGVVPLEDQRRTRRGGSAHPQSPPERARARGAERAAKPERAARPGAERPRRGPPPPAEVVPAAPADTRREDMVRDSAPLQQELAATRARAERAEAELSALRAALDQARTDLDQARTDQDERDKLDAERRQLHEQCRRLREDLAEARQTATRRTPLQTVLENRGLVSMNEMILALSGLLGKRPQELLDAVELAEPDALATLLDQRIALVHDDGGAHMTAAVVLHVSPDRCEITGGSDIRGAFRRLLDACQAAADMHEITIVGGSPAYRQQLKELAEPHRAALRLNLVSGTRRRTRRRAAADMRKSDLVVIWGATELDHSVSAVYTGDGAPLLRVPHRGISRMLEQVAESVRGRRG